MVGLPVVYINLDEALERREAMEHELARAGVCASRLSAVRWTQVPSALQQQLYSPALNARQYHLPLVNGEKGCYTSHLLACEALLCSDHPAMVVLEDDVKLEPCFTQVLQHIGPHLGSFDVLKLFQAGRDQLLHSRPLGPAAQMGCYARVPSYTAAQVITREGAERMLASRVPFGRPIDVDQRHWWENRLRIRGLMPQLVSLADASQDSSISGRDQSARAWRVRLKKLRWRAAYNLLNAWHTRRRIDQ